MKTLSFSLIALVLGFTSFQMHSQSKTAESPGATLIQLKAGNEALILRQAATLEVLKTLEAESNQLRIVSKRG